MPNLLKTAKKEGRKVYYGDEASFFVTPKLQKCFLPQANPFPVEICSKSFGHIFVCSAISSEGDFTYTTSKQPYRGEDIVWFLEQLLADEPNPITLIWDQASVHDCKAVHLLLEKLPKGRLKLVKQPA
ncbi:transposase [Chondrinema litorale]|uniref:transposase n=1 Tax=Chondrinema litorale TaxID=2994555 RepID=UPI002543EB3E|nr:transposase [Chondrinema litorale]UZR99950.1 transposase [Chondrinema litorale]